MTITVLFRRYLGMTACSAQSVRILSRLFGLSAWLIVLLLCLTTLGCRNTTPPTAADIPVPTYMATTAGK